MKVVRRLDARPRPAAAPAAPHFRRQAKRSRRGAVMVETAIVMTALIALTLGAIDLQIGVYRYNTLSEAARHGARQAMVHGAMATAAQGIWGPGAYNGTAGDGSPYANAVQPLLVGFPQDNVSIELEWLDGSNAVGKRVRYTLSTTYSPLLGFLIGYPTMTLQAASTMPIAH
ncbi:MAG TPA: TadE family protein [Pirellulales bacterium]|nr:TadE family protein [Pirellulales bacterium]